MVLFYQNITRGLVVPMTASNEIQMLIQDSASWGGKVELLQVFLVLLLKWKML